MQLIDYIILEVCNSGPNIKKRVTHILNMRGGTLKTIRQIMRGIYLKIIDQNLYNDFIKYSIKCNWIYVNRYTLFYFIEYAGNLGEDGDKEWQEQEQRHILKMVDKL